MHDVAVCAFAVAGGTLLILVANPWVVLRYRKYRQMIMACSPQRTLHIVLPRNKAKTGHVTHGTGLPPSKTDLRLTTYARFVTRLT